MTDLLDSLLRMSPIAVALIVLVILFLRYLCKAEKANRDERRANFETLNRIVTNHMTDTQKSNDNLTNAINNMSETCKNTREIVLDRTKPT